MIQLYTAVGRYEIEKHPDGSKEHIVTVNGKEMALSKEEWILWTSLLWNILTMDEAKTVYQKRSIGANVDPDSFEWVLHRLEIRGLIVCSEALRGDEALYNLLANLYVVPVKSGFLEKAAVFMSFVFKQHIPFSVAKTVFRKEVHTEMEQKVLHLSNQSLLSCAEILKCIENGVTDVSTSEKILEALYDDDYSTCDNLGLFMRFYDNYRNILEAVATLYLNRNVIFDKLA